MVEKKASPLDALVAHFRERRSGLLSLEIPEWGPMTIWFSPAISVLEADKFTALAQDGKLNESVAMQLIQRARDEQGHRLFADAELTVMVREADATVINRVVTEMQARSAKVREQGGPAEDDRGN